VLVQTVAGSMAIMPLGCGFVGVVPAMNYLLREEEMGPVRLSLGKMVLWGLGLCYFGVVFAVPLRRQVVIRERLRFPSGFSTAVLIGVLHGEVRKGGDEGFAGLVPSKFFFFPFFCFGVWGLVWLGWGWELTLCRGGRGGGC
jgi:uncharacterized oligopeptide transporter (OPT) family protein